MNTVSSFSAAILLLGWSAGSQPCEPVQVQTPPKASPDPAPYVYRGAFLRHVIETEPFQEEMPLGRFLKALEKQLPKEEKISLRIDVEAFGDKAAAVAGTPVKLPAHPKRMQLGVALRLALAKVKTKTDVRLGDSEYVITTPERALFTAVHDIRIIHQIAGSSTTMRDLWKESDPSRRAALLVQLLYSTWSPFDGRVHRYREFAPELFEAQVLNDSRLIIRGNQNRHAEVDDMIRLLRTMGDMAVFVNTRLYEVDDDFYQKLKNMKLTSWEEEERLLLDGKPSPWDALFKLLKKQKRVQSGDEVKVGDGAKAVLLSRHKVVTCLPGPAQLRKGEKGRQTILLGVSFVGQIQVSPDRRSVRVKLTETDTELQEIKKLKVLPTWAEEVDVEIPFLNESTHARVVEIPDGGTILVPVHIRSKGLPKDRHWVLAISPRIWMKEEEEMIATGWLSEALPLVIADVLKNPRLKALRETYGSPGDKRYALVNGPAWTWSKEKAVAGFELTPAKRAGQRLLGIRVENYKADFVTISLLNAGGSSNGPAIGAGTIRYTGRSTEKGWRVELSENVEP